MYEFHASTYPVRVHSGQHALAGLPAELDRCGAKRAFVLCGKSVAERTDLMERIRALLGERLVGVYAGIAKDAPVDCVLDAVEKARAYRPDILLAVGAGSVIKAARIIAILLAESRPIDQLITQYPANGRPVSPRLNAAKCPIVNILTAATSAQNRGGSALKSGSGGYRMEFFDPKTRPVAIFWDADALLTAPKSLALSTAVSVYWRALMNIGAVEKANPLVQASRYQAFRLAHGALPRVSDPADYRARIDLCAAALLQNRDEDDGGRPFDMHWVTRVIYALAAATFNLIPSIDQGQANAALTGAAIRQFGDKCLDVTIGMGRAIGAWEDGMDEREAPARIGNAVDELFRRFGMATRLRDLNVGREQLADIVGFSFKNFNADRERSFVNEAGLLSATLQDAW
jgi:alcohol dehydrogenase class IV